MLQQVPASSVNENDVSSDTLETFLESEGECDGVESREVCGSGWYGVFWENGEWVRVDLGVWDVCVECPVGNKSVELGWESLLSDGGVESDLGGDDWVSSEESRVVEELVVVELALSSDDKVEFEDWVGHVELDVLEVRLVLSVLVLDDDGVEWGEGELVTFLGVDEDAHDEERGGDVGWGDFCLGGGVENLDVWSRDDDESLEVLDTEGDVHVCV